MRALVKSRAAPGIWMEELPIPEPGPQELLIRVGRTSICGSDVHIWNWDRWAQSAVPIPMTVGHEFMGTVVGVGTDVVGFVEGQRLSVEGHVTCGTCRNCRSGRRHLCPYAKVIGVQRPGACAEFVVVPAINAYLLPPSLPDDIASCLDPLGNAVHCALSFELVGKDVLITGAGPIGVMAAAVSRFAGARNVVVTDINPFRLDLARRMGATRAVDVASATIDQAMQELEIDGFDVGLEMSGAPTALRSMLAAMHHGGGIAILGIPPEEVAINWNQVIFKGLVLKGIYGREIFETWYRMGQMLETGLDISAVITHRFPADRFAEAYDTVRSGMGSKVVLDWT